MELELVISSPKHYTCEHCQKHHPNPTLSNVTEARIPLNVLGFRLQYIQYLFELYSESSVFCRWIQSRLFLCWVLDFEEECRSYEYNNNVIIDTRMEDLKDINGVLRASEAVQKLFEKLSKRKRNKGNLVGDIRI